MKGSEVTCEIAADDRPPHHDLVQHPARPGHLAVGETVILLHPRSSSLLKHLLKGEGGAAE